MGFGLESCLVYEVLGRVLFDVGLLEFFLCLLSLDVSYCILPVYFGAHFIFNKIGLIKKKKKNL